MTSDGAGRRRGALAGPSPVPVLSALPALPVRSTLPVLLASALVLGGCSGGGDGRPTPAQVVDRLRADPVVARVLLGAAGGDAGRLDPLRTCVAEAMLADAPSGDVAAYLGGRKSFDQVGQTTHGARTSNDTALAAGVTACVRAGESPAGATPPATPPHS